MMMMMMMLPIHFHYAFNIRCFLLREFVVNVCLSGILNVMPIAVQCGQWKKTMMMEWGEGWIDQPYHRRRAHWNDEVKTMVDIGQLKQMLNHMVKRFVPLHIRAGVYRWCTLFYSFLSIQQKYTSIVYWWLQSIRMDASKPMCTLYHNTLKTRTQTRNNHTLC